MCRFFLLRLHIILVSCTVGVVVLTVVFVYPNRLAVLIKLIISAVIVRIDIHTLALFGLFFGSRLLFLTLSLIFVIIITLIRLISVIGLYTLDFVAVLIKTCIFRYSLTVSLYLCGSLIVLIFEKIAVKLYNIALKVNRNNYKSLSSLCHIILFERESLCIHQLVLAYIIYYIQTVLPCKVCSHH